MDAPDTSFDARDTDTIRGIALHYVKYGEYEKALLLYLMLHEEVAPEDTATVEAILDLSYRTGERDIYLRFIESQPKDDLKKLGPLRVALYHLVRGDVGRSLAVFKKHVR